MPATWNTAPLSQVPPTAGGPVFGGILDNGNVSWLAVPPVNEDVPHVLVNGAVASSAAVGAALTCTMGNWLGTPTGYAYQWKSGATNVGTNSNTYTVVAGDIGNNVTCTVTATNASGSTVAPPSNAISCHA
jgi:hypothetical protein